MGLFWSEEKVDWGAPGRGSGRLLGKLATGKRGGSVDFWEQRGVYALYANYKLVYVGQTAKQDMGKRLRDHRRDDKAERWDRFSWFGLRIVRANNTLTSSPKHLGVSAADVIDQIEGVLTIVAEPPLNRQKGRWRNVELYLQSQPPASDETLLPTTIRGRRKRRKRKYTRRRTRR